MGYDIAIVDFEWGGNDIDVNVAGLRDAIEELNDMLAINNSDEQLVVMGLSMGALISRIALSEMTNHNARLYISFDGPHQGAYIPMPLQAVYSSLIDDEKEKIPGLLDIMFKMLRNLSPLECPAAQQMLMSHYLASPNNSPFNPTSEHTTLYNRMQHFWQIL